VEREQLVFNNRPILNGENINLNKICFFILVDKAMVQ
jgi:hypothetical protein